MIQFKSSIFQEKSNFARYCRKKGGLFKCCVQSFTLSIFETSRNKLIAEGLIKDKPTNWCLLKREQLVGRDLMRKGPCATCNADGMCSKMDLNTGEIRHTFLMGYKKEHRVIK